jgi:hypothetical protein
MDTPIPAKLNEYVLLQHLLQWSRGVAAAETPHGP